MFGSKAVAGDGGLPMGQVRKAAAAAVVRPGVPNSPKGNRPPSAALLWTYVRDDRSAGDTAAPSAHVSGRTAGRRLRWIQSAL